MLVKIKIQIFIDPELGPKLTHNEIGFLFLNFAKMWPTDWVNLVELRGVMQGVNTEGVGVKTGVAGVSSQLGMLGYGLG